MPLTQRSRLNTDLLEVLDNLLLARISEKSNTTENLMHKSG